MCVVVCVCVCVCVCNARSYVIFDSFLFALLQQELDPENPECVLDGLILQQMKEYETLGKPINFTDEMLGALVFDVFDAGTQNFL